MDTKNKALANNIYKEYIFSILNYFTVDRGIWMLYLAAKGLNLLQIGIMESVYHITSFTMEVPTGIIADLYGRKTSRILSCIARSLSVLLMLLGTNIFVIALSFVASAISNNLESGAGEALIYDSLKEINNEGNFSKLKGRFSIFMEISSSVALVVGGYLGTIDYSYVYITYLVFALCSIIHAFSFTEPTIGRIEVNSSTKGLDVFINQLKQSINVIKSDKRIGFLIVMSELFGTFVTTIFFYIQNYLKSTGNSEYKIGIILALSGICAAIASSLTYRLENRFSFNKLLTILPLIAIFCFGIITIPSLTDIAFIALYMIDAILVIITSDYINRLIPSQQRATILSFQSMSFSLFMIILFPIVGRIGDSYSLLTAFRLVGVIASIILILIILFVRKSDQFNKIKS